MVKSDVVMVLMLVPSHKLASWLLSVIGSALDAVGIGGGSGAEEVVYVLAVVAIAVGVGWLVRWTVVLTLKRLPMLRRWEFVKEMIERRVVSRCSRVISPLLFLALIPFAFDVDSAALSIIERMATVYLLVEMGVAVCAVLEFLWTRYDRHHNERNVPLRGVLNVGRGAVWIVVLIISVSVLINRSPTVLLTGLGAFAAALMLVFKDSLLGLVAGVQIAQNDLLRVGDWIIVPTTLANGIVTDVSLSAVKIRNWDNTIVSLPPYVLVSSSFQNWRGMSDSGVRLITRTVVIDATSVKPCTPSLIEEITAKIPLLRDYIGNRPSDYGTGLTPVNGTVDTNLGLLRAYACRYLLLHPMVAHNQQILVSLKDQTDNGLPVQLYCYAATTDWAAFEAIQSEIVEHIVAICPTMYLTVYNSVSGKDIRPISR